MSYVLDTAVPYYVAYVGGRWGEDVCPKPGSFNLHACKGLRILKRHFSLSKNGDYHTVPRWARSLAETLASSDVDPSVGLMLAKTDETFRDEVRAVTSLGGCVGLRDFLRGRGLIL